MRAIAVSHDRAPAIAAGTITLEPRCWAPTHRGPLAIVQAPAGPPFGFGTLMAVCELVDVRLMTPADTKAADYEFGPCKYVLVLANARRVDRPMRVRSDLLMFEVDEATAEPPRPATARAPAPAPKPEPAGASLFG